MADGASAAQPAPPVHVVILQVSDAQGIVWQRFFHGDSGQSTGQVNRTFARGISVFPGPTEAETRIAICGETFDLRIPYGQGQVNSSSLGTEASGFIAVYDGDGNLLWTYHFYGEDAFAGTVMTDVSLHVDSRSGTAKDVVTYCGMSRNGVFVGVPPVQPSTMAPLRPFAAPPPLGTDLYPAGDTHNQIAGSPISTHEWDGVIGRLSAPHAPTALPAPVTRVFHSIVGGLGRDALFGITERTMDVFAVVGVTMTSPLPPSQSAIVFPLTRPQWNGAPLTLYPNTYMHGVVAEFDASGTRASPPQPLQLTGSTLIGGPGAHTVARDVLWHGGRYYVVGSTDDPQFLAGFAGPFVASPGSPSSGYVVTTTSPGGAFEYASHCPQSTSGGVCATGAVGVAAWNEYPDHVAILGWVQKEANGPRNLVVVSLFHDSLPPATTPHLDLVRQYDILSGGDEVPAARDSDPGIVGWPLFSTGLNFSWGGSSSTFVSSYHAVGLSFGDPGGGGLGVDPRGLLTVVGSTTHPNYVPGSNPPQYLELYPVAPEGAKVARAMQPKNPPTPAGQDFDAIHSVVDMLPDGVCRSDRTGSCPAAGWAPSSGAAGGTTPVCALSQFGSILGTTPILKRMFVDYEGYPSPGQPVSLLVDQPPPASWVVLSGWQVGIPNNAPVLLTGHDVELWTMSGSGDLWIGAYAPTGGSLREAFGGSVFPGGATYMAQYVCLLAQPLAGTPCTAPDLTWAATPALVFSY